MYNPDELDDEKMHYLERRSFDWCIWGLILTALCWTSLTPGYVNALVLSAFGLIIIKFAYFICEYRR